MIRGTRWPSSPSATIASWSGAVSVPGFRKMYSTPWATISWISASAPLRASAIVGAPVAWAPRVSVRVIWRLPPAPRAVSTICLRSEANPHPPTPSPASRREGDTAPPLSLARGGGGGWGLVSALPNGRLCFLAEEPERLDHRAVAEGEQHRLAALAGVLVPGPGRHHERVALLPVELLAVDNAVPAALCHVVHRACRMAVGPGVLASPQQLKVRRHRRERRSAGVRVDVLHDDAVKWAGLVVAQGMQRRAAGVPTVVQDRRVGAIRPLVGW